MKFSGVPPAFDAALFLPGMELAAFLEPALLELPGVPTGKPCPPPARQPGNRADVLEIFAAWDKSDRLELFPAAACPAGQRMRLQAVAKDEVKDRLICNRQRRNFVELKILGASGELPSASVLSDLILQPDHVLTTWASDLRDMYHSFVVSEARAVTNGVALALTSDEAARFPRAKPRLRVHQSRRPLPELRLQRGHTRGDDRRGHGNMLL